MPADDADVAIVHGDYRLDNLLIGDDDQMRAVVDWEMSTLGDPLTDLALLLVYDRLSDVAGGGGRRRRQPGARLPGPDEQLERYAAAQRPRPRPAWTSTSASPSSSSP